LVIFGFISINVHDAGSEMGLSFFGLAALELRFIIEGVVVFSSNRPPIGASFLVPGAALCVVDIVPIIKHW